MCCEKRVTAVQGHLRWLVRLMVVSAVGSSQTIVLSYRAESTAVVCVGWVGVGALVIAYFHCL